MSNPSCSYQVDAHDKILTIGGNWTAFAKANGGESLILSPPLGHSIWDYIEGLSTRLIYQILISKVRTTGETLCFPFRCDSAETRRYMEMEISLGTANTVWFETTLKREYRQKPTPAPKNQADKDTAIKMCAWCKLVWTHNTWLPLEEAIWLEGLLDSLDAPPFTHGICPDCNRLINNEMQEIKRVASAE